MEKEKVVLFDWGGVLIDQNNKRNSFDAVNTRLIDWADPKDRVRMRLMFFDPKLYVLNGKVLMDFISDSLRVAGSEKTVQEFCNQYAEEICKVPYFFEMKDLVALTGKYAKIGIFSTMSKLDYSRFSGEYQGAQFDYQFFSYALGADKESGKMFDIASSIIGVHTRPVEVLLLDDSEKIVEKANSLANWRGKRVDGDDYGAIRSALCDFLNLSMDEFSLGPEHP